MNVTASCNKKPYILAIEGYANVNLQQKSFIKFNSMLIKKFDIFFFY